MKTHLQLHKFKTDFVLHSYWSCRASLVLLFLISLSSAALGQQINQEWDKVYGLKSFDDEVHFATMVAAPDGGYLLGGDTESKAYWIVKTDTKGNKLWDKTFGGDSYEHLEAIITTEDGGYLLGGYSSSGKSGGKSEENSARDEALESWIANYDYWIVKIDAQGNKIWDKTLGGNRSDYLSSMVTTPDGGYLLGGYSSSAISGDKSEASRGDNDYWVVKIDAQGNKVWDKTLGGNKDDNFTALLATSDGGYLLGGYSKSGISSDKSQPNLGTCEGQYCTRDYWVVKINGNGAKVWDKTFGGNEDDILRTMINTPDGNYLLGGDTRSNLSGSKSQDKKGYWIVKIDNTGEEVWDKTFGGNGYYNMYTVVANAEGYLLGGFADIGIDTDKSEASRGDFDYWIVQVSADGNTKLWDKTFGGGTMLIMGKEVGADILKTILPTADGGYLLGGESAAVAGNEKSEDKNGYWIIKVKNTATSPPMDTTVALSYGGSGADRLIVGLKTKDGGYLAGGYSNSGISGDKSEASRGGFDYWVVKTDAKGNELWDKTFGGSEDDKLVSIIATEDGGYLLGGSSLSGVSSDKSEPNRGESHGKTEDYWIIKIDAEGNKVWDKTFGSLYSDELEVIVATKDGGYLLAGGSTGGGGDRTAEQLNYMDSWLVKIDSNGNKVWDKALSFDADEQYLTAIFSTPDGGYLLGGTSKKYGSMSANFQNPSYSLAVVKINADGEEEWEKGFYGNRHLNKMQAMIPTANGHYLLGGTSYDYTYGYDEDHIDYVTGTTPNDYYIIDIDGNGLKQWERTIGGTGDDKLAALLATPDGGYLLGGSSTSGISGDRTEANISGYTYKDSTGAETFRPLSDYWVVKLNQNGDKLWDKAFGNDSDDATASGGNYLSAMLVAPDSSYLLGGTRNWDGSEQHDSDFWVVKVEDTATPPVTNAWNVRFGSAGTDRFTTVIKTKDGGYLLGGYAAYGSRGDKGEIPSAYDRDYAGRGGYDFWIIKTDKHGNRLWNRTYGGTADDYLNRIIPTKDGGYLLAGSSKSGLGGDKTEASQGDQDYWIIKISSDGTKQWDKTYGGSRFDDLRKVNQLSNGNYLLVGQSNSPLSGDKSQPSWGSRDYWVVMIDSNGNKLWDKRYGGSGREDLESFTKTPDGGFLLAGSSASGKSGDKTQDSQGGKDYWLVKINSSGTMLWDKAYGGNKDDVLYSIGITGNGEYFVAGHSSSGKSGDKSQISQGGSDYWMLKLSKTGAKLWDKSFGGAGDETLRSIIQAKDGGYVLAGSSDSGVSGDKTQPSQGGTDYWLVKTDEQGNKEYDQRFGGAGNDEFRYIQHTPDGGYLLGGRSDSGASGDKSQPSQGGTDYWLVKVGPVTGTAVAAAVAGQSAIVAKYAEFSGWPNPFSDRITISFNLKRTQAISLKLYDSQGRIVSTLYEGEVQGGKAYEVQWRPAANQSKGIYILRLQTADHTSFQRLILNK
ncbi:T9SS type A sorting domain-containing protein [Pontibacter sp. 172403-2]|uniref:T9SS type A sorting domain-containing protein n=1 Tax=Pontibacter rufus TaxID=2791028 RepID=UPI0018AFA61C|nr:T9SS type A sorting domain-containing protein [Pontibacter sp. 172403-2]MBF9253004.1 T9SS type A sorting domain-containing protein [Pontibacter sp. 172403-2]